MDSVGPSTGASIGVETGEGTGTVVGTGVGATGVGAGGLATGVGIVTGTGPPAIGAGVGAWAVAWNEIKPRRTKVTSIAADRAILDPARVGQHENSMTK
jgi:hypothetical protein